MDAVFQGLGMALLMCAVVWLTLPRPKLSRPEGGLLFAKLIGAFMALHLAALAVVPGGANVVITTLATYAIGRWFFLRGST